MEEAERVLIAGGGLAGLAAAAALADRGVPVTVLESRPRLGGRATSFEDKATGDLVDNCQHVGMGCCTNLRAFCERVGIADRFRVERELTFIDAAGRRSRFRANRLPAPLHLATALAGLRYFSWRERMQLARGLAALAREDVADEPLSDWLDRHDQPDRVRRLFWHVVLVSALSETLDRVSAPVARKVVVDGFLRHREAWEVHLPDAPLDDLYGDPVVRFLTERGGEVRTGAAVASSAADADGVRLRLRDGAEVRAGDLVIAVPHHRAASVAPAELSADLAGAGSLEVAPIASVHLWLDREIADLPHAVFVEHLSQWMFKRPSPRPGVHYVQVVISASRDVLGRPHEDVVADVLGELRSAFPDAADAEVLNARVVAEKRAVFSPLPGHDANRPPQGTRLPRVFLAGDWTRTGWPATMEGAVRSGHLAAEAVLRRRGLGGGELVEDLPAARLSRWAGLAR